MSQVQETEYTGIRIDREVHTYLFQEKHRPAESFNSVVRRKLGLPPEASD